MTIRANPRITKYRRYEYGTFCDLLAPVFEGVFKHIAITLSTVLDVILGIVDVFISVFQGDWSGAWEAVKGIRCSPSVYRWIAIRCSSRRMAPAKSR